jgi:hypothetical protein
MKLPVFAIVRAIWRDMLGFIRRHPLALAVTLLCEAGVNYGLARFVLEVEPRGVAAAVPRIIAAAVTLIIWLPCIFAGVRSVVSAQHAPIEMLGLLRPATTRYFDLSLLLSLPALILVPLVPAYPAFALPMMALAGVAFFLELRTTLALTAFALGHLAPGPRASYQLTSGQTFRLLAILVLSLLPFGALFLLGVPIDPERLVDKFEYPLLAMLLSSVVGIAGLIPPLAGAHVFRAMIIEMDEAPDNLLRR